MTSSPFSVALDAKAALGECPVWSVADQALWFVDIKGRALHRFDPTTGEHRTKLLPEDIGCFAPAIGGGFVAGLRSGIWMLSDDGTPVKKLANNPEDQDASRFNDGRTDPAGRFIAGTIDEAKAGGKANLYRFDSRGLAVLATGLLTSNGLAFSPDGRTLYHSDTPRFTVFAYDYDATTGTPSNRRVFVQLEASGGDRGRPDGAAVDGEGCYWTALYEGARVQRYAPDGRLLAEYPVPSQCPTMVAFGGPDMRTLFVTSARDGRPEPELAALPQSGALFSMRTDVAGRADPLFDPAA